MKVLPLKFRPDGIHMVYLKKDETYKTDGEVLCEIYGIDKETPYQIYIKDPTWIEQSKNNVPFLLLKNMESKAKILVSSVKRRAIS